MSDWRSSNKRPMGNVRAGNPNRALIIAARIALTRPDFPNQNVNGPRPIVGSFPWKRPVLPSARGQFLDDGASGNYPPDSLISIIIGSHPVNFPESESWPRHVDLSARQIWMPIPPTRRPLPWGDTAGTSSAPSLTWPLNKVAAKKQAGAPTQSRPASRLNASRPPLRPGTTFQNVNRAISWP